MVATNSSKHGAPLAVAGPAAGGRLDSATRARISEILEARRAKSTLASYHQEFRRWSAFCHSLGVAARPASPETVAAYLVYLMDVKRFARASVSRALTVIRLLHADDQVDPTKSALVAETWKGVKRSIRHPIRRALVIGIEELMLLVDALKTPGYGAGSARDIRDRAILALGWAGALRASEIVALNWGDWRRVSSGAEITITRSKTDQESEGRIIAVPVYRGFYATICPVRLLDLLLNRQMKTDKTLGPSTPIFRAAGFGPGRNELTASRADKRAVSRAVERAARLAHLPGNFTSHSLRRGFATSAAIAGIGDRSIMRHGRWASRTTLDGYVERGELWTDNPLMKMLG